MQFIYPSFLWALLLTVVPVIIYFLNFRRHKTVYFSNVEFLKHIKKEHKRRSRLKELLILLSRIMAIVTLVLWFAQPYFSANSTSNQQKVNQTAIFIDNSMSMQTITSAGSALENAKQKAISIVKSYPRSMQFLVLSNGANYRYATFSNAQQAIESINQLEFSSISTNYNDVRAQLNLHLKQEDKEKQSTALYFISDFQKNTLSENNSNDSLAIQRWIPIETQQVSNLLIDTCWFDSPARKLNRSESLTISIQNRSEETFTDIPIQLKINEKLKASGAVSIGPNEKKEVKLSFSHLTSGWKFCNISLSDYPIVFDNNFYMSYFVSPAIKVLQLNGNGATEDQFVSTLMAKDSIFQFESIAANQLPAGQLNRYDAVYISGVKEWSNGLTTQLKQYVDQGGTLALFPELDGSVTTYNQLLTQLNTNTLGGLDTVSTSIQSINKQHILFQSVFEKINNNALFPKINQHFRIATSANSLATPIMKFGGNEWATSSSISGKGKIFTFSFPLNKEATNFVEHPLFIPILYNMALNSQYTGSLHYPIHTERVALPLPYPVTSTNGIRVLDDNTQTDFLPEAVFIRGNQLVVDLDPMYNQAGHFKLFQTNQLLNAYSMNMSRKESDLNCITTNQLMEKAKEYSNCSVLSLQANESDEALAELQHGKQLWRWFVVLFLLFIAAEIAIIRFWK
ncbi:VWA domain-containing protein [Prolixibacteraceae bacterium JC049]|nr:VWA domain-containing protein [Prolixibacteraceae bacterium JC049]